MKLQNNNSGKSSTTNTLRMDESVAILGFQHVFIGVDIAPRDWLVWLVTGRGVQRAMQGRFETANDGIHCSTPPFHPYRGFVMWMISNNEVFVTYDHMINSQPNCISHLQITPADQPTRMICHDQPHDFLSSHLNQHCGLSPSLLRKPHFERMKSPPLLDKPTTLTICTHVGQLLSCLLHGFLHCFPHFSTTLFPNLRRGQGKNPPCHRYALPDEGAKMLLRWLNDTAAKACWAMEQEASGPRCC